MQPVPLAVKPLGGHAAAKPVQFSAGSQVPVVARQTVAELMNVSAGQPPAPPVQVSVRSQGPALTRQTVPAGFAGLLQTPVAGAHVPAVWHKSCAVQVTELAPVHEPAWHVSVWVQALPSLHAAPSALLGLLQTPVAGAHVPAV